MRDSVTRLCGPLVVLAAALSGCGLSRNPADTRRFFLLEAVRDGRVDPPARGPVLTVMPLQMSPRYRERELVYRTSDVACESDYYNQFLSAAGMVIAEQTARWLGRAGLFAAVVGPSSHATPTHVIEGNVTALYGDFRNDKAPTGVLGIEYFLIAAGDADDEPAVVFHKQYQTAVALSAPSAEALVKAYNDGLARILADFEKDLRQSLAPGDKAP